MHVGDVCVELDPNGFAHEDVHLMTHADYADLFALQQQYLSFTGRAKRDRCGRKRAHDEEQHQDV